MALFTDRFWEETIEMVIKEGAQHLNLDHWLMVVRLGLSHL